MVYGTLRDQVYNSHVTGEHSYSGSFTSTLPNQCIYADGTDMINDSAKKKKRVAVSYPYF